MPPPAPLTRDPLPVLEQAARRPVIDVGGAAKSPAADARLSAARGVVAAAGHRRVASIDGIAEAEHDATETRIVALIAHDQIVRTGLVTDRPCRGIGLALPLLEITAVRAN